MTRLQGTLDFHVLEVVNSLDGDGAQFSAYDVTSRIRKRINDGEIEILGRPFVSINVNGSFVSSQRVEHNEVRDRVHFFFESGQFPNIQRFNNGTYWEYIPQQPLGIVTPAATAPVATTTPAGFGYSYPTSVGVAAPAPVATISAVTQKDPLEKLTEKSRPVLRLRYTANQKYIVLPNGKTVWTRKCDLTQSVRYGKKTPALQAVETGLSNGTIEVVTVA